MFQNEKAKFEVIIMSSIDKEKQLNLQVILWCKIDGMIFVYKLFVGLWEMKILVGSFF